MGAKKSEIRAGFGTPESNFSCITIKQNNCPFDNLYGCKFLKITFKICPQFCLPSYLHPHLIYIFLVVMSLFACTLSPLCHFLSLILSFPFPIQWWCHFWMTPINNAYGVCKHQTFLKFTTELINYLAIYADDEFGSLLVCNIISFFFICLWGIRDNIFTSINGFRILGSIRIK